jgi:hypothetical protein
MRTQQYWFSLKQSDGHCHIDSMLRASLVIGSSHSRCDSVHWVFSNVAPTPLGIFQDCDAKLNVVIGGDKGGYEEYYGEERR